MNIRQLGLIALLGGALMAMGCGNDDNGGGGTGGMGGEGGAGGEGGMGGGVPFGTTCDPLEGEQEAFYEVTCENDTVGEILIVFRVISTSGPLFIGTPTEVTTCAEAALTESLVIIARSFASTITEGDAALAVTGAMPAAIAHSIPNLPAEVALNTALDEVTTELTANVDADTVTIVPSTATIVISTSIGDILVEVGEAPCSDFVLQDGSTELTIPVEGS